MPEEPLIRNYFYLVDSCHPLENGALKRWKLPSTSEVNAFPYTKTGQKSECAVCSMIKKRFSKFRAEDHSVLEASFTTLFALIAEPATG